MKKKVKLTFKLNKKSFLLLVQQLKKYENESIEINISMYKLINLTNKINILHPNLCHQIV